jgi:hypothetical protein
MKTTSIALAALTLPLVASPAFAQSLASRLLNATGQAVSSALSRNGTSAPSTQASGDGIHSRTGYSDWHYPTFAPDTIDGYTHLRVGAASLDQFGNAVNGRDVCDREYVGYGLMHRAELTPGDARHCLSVEQANDAGASLDTIRQRMEQLGATRKFYTRGTAKVDATSDPSGQLLPPGKAVVEFGFGGATTIVGPDDVDFVLVGPHWIHPGWRPGFIDNGFALVFDADPSMKARWAAMAATSYVYFTVGQPTNKRPSTWQRGHTMYDLPITIDKIVLTDGRQKLVLTPPKMSAPK